MCSIPAHAARAPATVVYSATRCCSAARRIMYGIAHRSALLLHRVHDQRDLAVLDHVHYVRTSFLHLVDGRHGRVPPPRSPRPCRAWPRARSRRRASWRAISIIFGLSASRTLMNTLPAAGSALARRDLGFHERLGKGRAHAHHLAGRFHLRPEYRVGARKLDEREHRFLDREIAGDDRRVHALRRRESCPPCSAPRSWQAAPPSPSIRTARCATRADSPPAHKPRPDRRASG